jgi:VWFA-related protein
MFRIAPVVALLLAIAPGKGQSAEGRLVDLNVVALDNHGQPVADLTASDFEINDAGKPRNIAFFHRYGRTLRRLGMSGPNQYSNRGGANIPHATLILFDLLNESFSTRGNAASRLERDLQSLENADYLYLYLLTVDGRLFAVHGLPGPNGEAHQPNEVPWTKRIKPMLDQAMNTVMRVRPVELDIALRVQATYAALGTIAAQLSVVPGRKNIVWITDGVPVVLGPNRSDTGDFVDFSPQIRRLSEALSDTGVAIYPVQQILLGSGDTSGGSGFSSAVTLESFADQTGGRHDQGKDIGPAIRQAMNDVRNSYQIAYYEPDDAWDGKFHKLRVTCKRKGVHIQTKSGYYASLDPAAGAAENLLASARSTLFDAAELGITASVSPEGGADHSVHIEARIDGSDVVWDSAGGKYTASLRVGIIGFLENGQTENSAMFPLNVSDTPEQHDKDVEQGIAFVQDVKVGSEVKRLRFVAIDQKSRAMGTVTFPVHQDGPAPAR